MIIEPTKSTSSSSASPTRSVIGSLITGVIGVSSLMATTVNGDDGTLLDINKSNYTVNSDEYITPMTLGLGVSCCLMLGITVYCTIKNRLCRCERKGVQNHIDVLYKKAVEEYIVQKAEEEKGYDTVDAPKPVKTDFNTKIEIDSAELERYILAHRTESEEDLANDLKFLKTRFQFGNFEHEYESHTGITDFLRGKQSSKQPRITESQFTQTELFDFKTEGSDTKIELFETRDVISELQTKTNSEDRDDYDSASDSGSDTTTSSSLSYYSSHSKNRHHSHNKKSHKHSNSRRHHGERRDDRYNHGRQSHMSDRTYYYDECGHYPPNYAPPPHHYHGERRSYDARMHDRSRYTPDYGYPRYDDRKRYHYEDERRFYDGGRESRMSERGHYFSDYNCEHSRNARGYDTPDHHGRPSHYYEERGRCLSTDRMRNYDEEKRRYQQEQCNGTQSRPETRASYHQEEEYKDDQACAGATEDKLSNKRPSSHIESRPPSRSDRRNQYLSDDEYSLHSDGKKHSSNKRRSGSRRDSYAERDRDRRRYEESSDNERRQPRNEKRDLPRGRHTPLEHKEQHTSISSLDSIDITRRSSNNAKGAPLDFTGTGAKKKTFPPNKQNLNLDEKLARERQSRKWTPNNNPNTSRSEKWFLPVDKPVQCGEYVLCKLAEKMETGDPNFANDSNYPIYYPDNFTDFTLCLTHQPHIPEFNFFAKKDILPFIGHQKKDAKFIVTSKMYGGHHFFVHFNGLFWEMQDQIGTSSRLFGANYQISENLDGPSTWIKVRNSDDLLALIATQKIQKTFGDDDEAFHKEFIKWLGEARQLGYSG